MKLMRFIYRPGGKTRALLVGGLAIGLVAAFWLATRTPAGLRYQGKPLGYWMRQMPYSGWYSWGGYEQAVQFTFTQPEAGSKEPAQRTVAAIQAIGTNGLPFLISKMSRRESRLELWFRKLAAKCGLHRLSEAHIRATGAQSAQAMSALLCLTPLPDYATRQLARLSTNSNGVIAMNASVLLDNNKTNLELIKQMIDDTKPRQPEDR